MRNIVDDIRRITIVLPVHGREEFTDRFMRYWMLRGLDYGPNIANRQRDNSLKAYYDKMAAATASVTTPYAMLADNDDFLGIHGISACMSILDNNPHLIAARGRQVTFRLHPLQSPKGTIQQIYWKEPLGPCGRLRYSVFRSHILHQLWEEIATLNPPTLEQEEEYFWGRAVELGICIMNPRYVTYYSQAGTGASYRKTWRRHLRFLKRRPQFILRRMKNKLLQDLPHASATDRYAIMEDFMHIEDCLK